MNVNFAELAVIFIVALLLFGPDQLPQIARQLGKLSGDLRKVTNSVRREWYNAVYPPASEIKRDLESGTQALRQLKAEVLAPPPGSKGTSTSATGDATKDSTASPTKPSDNSETQSS